MWQNGLFPLNVNYKTPVRAAASTAVVMPDVPVERFVHTHVAIFKNTIFFRLPVQAKSPWTPVVF